MERREFVCKLGSSLAGTAALSVSEAAPPGTERSASEREVQSEHQSGVRTRRAALMKVGTQHGSTNEILRVLAALGVNHICSSLPSARWDERWSTESLIKLRERVESFGIKLEMVPLPLSSSYITKAENPNTMLGKSPERDREIDDICEMIRNAARAGIPALKYNMSILGVVRTGTSPGRGGAQYSTFV